MNGPLSGAHRYMLEVESGIAPDVIAERGYWSAPTWLALKAGGVHLQQSQVRVASFPALVLPQHDPAGEHTHDVVRWDHPRMVGGKRRRYDQPAGVGLRLDVPLRCLEGLRDPDLPLWWTEGSKKADALASRGHIAVSCPGVESWRSPSAFLDLIGIPLKERVIIVAYDSDVLSKVSVRRALDTLSAWFKLKGAAVRVLDWRKVAAA